MGYISIIINKINVTIMKFNVPDKSHLAKCPTFNCGTFNDIFFCCRKIRTPLT